MSSVRAAVGQRTPRKRSENYEGVRSDEEASEARDPRLRERAKDAGRGRVRHRSASRAQHRGQRDDSLSVATDARTLGLEPTRERIELGTTRADINLLGRASRRRELEVEIRLAFESLVTNVPGTCPTDRSVSIARSCSTSSAYAVCVVIESISR